MTTGFLERVELHVDIEVWGEFSYTTWGECSRHGEQCKRECRSRNEQGPFGRKKHTAEPTLEHTVVHPTGSSRPAHPNLRGLP